VNAEVALELAADLFGVEHTVPLQQKSEVKTHEQR
jgi:hypothetical protein